VPRRHLGTIVGRVSLQGHMHAFGLPGAASQQNAPLLIAAGHDGNL
jgi:hypothetical protein